MTSSVVYVDGLTAKYALIAFIQRTASSVSPEKSAGSAALISVVLVVVDIRFAGGGAGLAGGCGGRTVGGGAVVSEVVETGGLVVDTAEDAAVTKGVTCPPRQSKYMTPIANISTTNHMLHIITVTTDWKVGSCKTVSRNNRTKGKP